LIKIRDKYKNKLKISAGIVVSDLTVNSIDQVREYAQKLQIDLVEAWYNICSFYKNYNESDKTKIKNKIIEIVKSQPFSPLQEKWLKHLEGKPFKFSCFAANRFFVLKCNGDIVPCLNLWDFKIGNVRESSIENIWKSIKAKEIRKVVKKCTGCLNS
jgi:MoaA/NifB/PqqE/SkfB family radical SAM enzyme